MNLIAMVCVGDFRSGVVRGRLKKKIQVFENNLNPFFECVTFISRVQTQRDSVQNLLHQGRDLEQRDLDL